MSTIVITSHGTLGENLPFIALGKVLKTRGHQVRMVINEAIHPYILKAGLETVNIERSKIGPQEIRRYARKWNHLLLMRAELLDIEKSAPAGFKYNLLDSIDCLMKACNDADMLISGHLQDTIAATIADIYNICWIRSCVTPFFHCLPKPESEHQTSSIDNLQNPKDLNHFILAASPYFCQLSPKYSQVHQTGFWFYEDPDWNSWQPSQELREFVEQEPKPLVLSFSSVSVENIREVIEAHVRAAAKLDRRLLIHKGWADFDDSYLPSDVGIDNVMFIDGLISHDWLFSRAGALITHGGVGTIARSLRNGCPMLVEPLANDQFFNALQVLRLGVGSAIDSQKLTADGIASVLHKKILTPDFKRRTVEVGEKIKAEQGLTTACNLIESWL
ncbi:MAG: glycosyltransferase [Rhizonema sp. PD38]|nr:glycosyltransferase [Rhizonema sp. PD38]